MVIRWAGLVRGSWIFVCVLAFSPGASGCKASNSKRARTDSAFKKPYLDIYLAIGETQRSSLGLSATELRTQLRAGLEATHRLRLVSKPEHAALQLGIGVQRGPSRWQAEIRTKKAKAAPAWLKTSIPPLGLSLAPDEWSRPGNRSRIVRRLAAMLGLELELRRQGIAAAQRALSGPSAALQGLALIWLLDHPQRHPGIAQRCLDLIKEVLKSDPDYDRAEALLQCVATCGSENDVPGLLDAVSARHERLILHRIETLGALGGEIARGELQMVLDNEKEGPLQEAARQALRTLGPDPQEAADSAPSE